MEFEEFKKRIKILQEAMVNLWLRGIDEYHEWSFKYYNELTDADIKEFCRIHDIMDLVSPEVYGESKLKLDVVTEVEFMDI